MKKIAPENMSSLLSGALQRAGIGRQVQAAMIVEIGNEALQALLGEGVLSYARCHAIVDGELRIACTHAALAQELQLRSTELVAHITKSLPRASIQSVYVRHRDTPERGAAWHEQRL